MRNRALQTAMASIAAMALSEDTYTLKMTCPHDEVPPTGQDASPTPMASNTSQRMQEQEHTG